MINIIIVEDNHFSRQALKEKLSVFEDIFVLYAAQNGQEALDYLASNNGVDLVLTDIEMPVMNGIQATELIKQRYPQLKIVMITIHDDDDSIFNAIRVGADSYILKETKAEKIYETITDTLNGGAVMSPSIAIKALNFLKNTVIPKQEQASVNTELSVREIEILELLSQGLTNKNIAERLFISPFTVKRHIENIYQKLQARNRVELLQKARQNKLL